MVQDPKGGAMIELDEALMSRARDLAETMAREGKHIEGIPIADSAEITVSREQKALSIALSTIRVSDGSTFYVGLR